MANILRYGFWCVFIAYALIGCSTELQVAAERGNLQVVSGLLNSGERISARNSVGWTALHYAARAGQDAVINLLLDKQAAIDARGDNGETPLFLASYNCHLHAVRNLLDRGANYSIEAKPDSYAWLTPLLIASKQGCAPQILQALLGAGADVNAIDEKQGWNALIFSANMGHHQAMEVLLLAGAAVNYQSFEGLTALIAAVGGGHKNAVQILLEADADVSITTSQDGNLLLEGLEPMDTALSVAKRRGHNDIVVLLEK